MATFYDTHAHLASEADTERLPGIIARAQQAGIRRILCIGTDLASSRRCIEIAEEHEGIHAVVGCHPSDVEEAPDDIREALRELASHPKVAALGETGLDYFRLPGKQGGSPEEDARIKARQASLFRQHLEIAAELRLNCVIHTRESLEDTIEQLRPFADRVRGVFHCFVDDANAMRRILALGSLVSFTGILTFKNAQTVRDTLSATPMGKFMLETDAPYLAPVPYRGKRCEPAYVKEIAETAAQVKGCTLTELATATNATAHEFFRL
ncbi:MAG: TatD family hydrolase [Verrucomicrobia bacterium]|nr:TatD family hydrolase [Verrucomicrobiota bacterium]